MNPKSKIDSKLANLEIKARPRHLDFETEARWDIQNKSHTRNCLETSHLSRGLSHCAYVSKRVSSFSTFTEVYMKWFRNEINNSRIHDFRPQTHYEHISSFDAFCRQQQFILCIATDCSRTTWLHLSPSKCLESYDESYPQAMPVAPS